MLNQCGLSESRGILCAPAGGVNPRKERHPEGTLSPPFPRPWPRTCRGICDSGRRCRNCPGMRTLPDTPWWDNRRRLMAEVTLDHVSKRYGTVVAVDDVSLAIRDGELMVLVGPSGCGKSTWLRTIAGLETASAGTISIGGRVVNDVAPKDRRIAMVFQSYALYPHMTVRQNLEYALKIAKMPAAERQQRVDAAAEALELDALLGRYPKQLSGGQRQRVAVGRAIVRQPDVFLFDEPLSNLDAGLRAQMRVDIPRLHERLRTTMIYVTHDQVEAMTLADRIVILNRGRIEQQG